MNPAFGPVADRLKARLRKAAAAASGALLAAWLLLLLLTLAIAWLSYAAFLALLPDFPPPAAAGLTATGLIVIGLLLGGIGYYVARNSARPRTDPLEPTAESDAAPEAMVAKALAAEAGEYLAKNPKSGVLVAFLAGGILGACPEIRAALADRLKRPRPQPPGPAPQRNGTTSKSHTR